MSLLESDRSSERACGQITFEVVVGGLYLQRSLARFVKVLRRMTPGDRAIRSSPYSQATRNGRPLLLQVEKLSRCQLAVGRPEEKGVSTNPKLQVQALLRLSPIGRTDDSGRQVPARRSPARPASTASAVATDSRRLALRMGVRDSFQPVQSRLGTEKASRSSWESRSLVLIAGSGVGGRDPPSALHGTLSRAHRAQLIPPGGWYG